MISEDHVTEDWINDAENTALSSEIYCILTYIHIENSYFKMVIIVQFVTVFLIK